MTQKEIEQIAAAVVEAISRATPICQKEFLTLEEAAQYTGLKKSALYKLTHNKIIPFSKPNGKMCYFRRTDIEDWMMSNPVSTTADLTASAQAYCMTKKPTL